MNEIQIAFKSPLVKETEEGRLKEILEGLILKSYVETGFSVDAKQVKMIANGLYPDMKTYFTTIRIDEIGIAFSRGVRQEYGKYTGLSITTFFGFLKNYMYSTERTEAKKMIPTWTEPTYSEEDKNKIAKEGALRCWNEFKETGEVKDFGNATYEFLKVTGCFKKYVPMKEEIKKRVRLKLDAQLKSEQANDPFRRNEIGKLIEEVLTKDDSKRLVSECKKAVLKMYFEELKSGGKELNV